MSAVFRKIGRAGPGARGFGIGWAGGRGAAGWLALVVLAVATAGFGGLAASPALAGSFVTVTTTSDENAVDGACSLREAILYAQNQNAGDTDCGTTATGLTTIIVPAGHYAFATASGDAHLQIGPGGPGPILIAGASTAGTVIDAQGHYPRLLLVRSGANVTIKNLTLQGGFGFARDGGGIYNQGTLTLDHVTVTASKTAFPFGTFTGEGRGGGIFNSGTLTLLGSIVSGNSTASGGVVPFPPPRYCGAPGNDGYPGADGGGLYNQGGTVTAINTSFTGNATGPGGDGGPGRDARSLSGCTGGGSGGAGGHGGDGGAIFNNAGFVTLRQSAIYGNTTGAGGHGGDGGFGSVTGGNGSQGGGGGAGAGIATNAMLTVVNTTITGNTTGNGGAGGAAGQSGNPAGAGAGGAPGEGGPGAGIYQQNGQATVQESTVAANVGGAGTGIAGLNEVPRASGIEVVAGELTEIDTIVSNNDCYAFPGGQIKDGLTAGDGHLNLTYPTASCPGIVANPLLQPLHDNGGPTPTMAIAPPSAALDRIPPTAAAGCTPADQRGTARPQPPGGRCDIGAFEAAP